MHIFYTPAITLPVFILDEQESKHAIKVLRFKQGDRVQLIDGKGGYYLAEIAAMKGKRCEMRVVAELPYHRADNYHLHLAVAPTKNIDRFEFFVEKATEMGIGEITPLLCERSERKVVKHDRLMKVCIAAAKQSIKPKLPKINELAELKMVLNSSKSSHKFVAHCFDHHDKKPLKDSYKPTNDVVILIGPEGDFSENEAALCEKFGFKPVSLGPERLRTETAALAACFTINLMNQ